MSAVAAGIVLAVVGVTVWFVWYYKFRTKNMVDDRTGITWVRIKGGSFQMGSNDLQPDQRPVFQVWIKTFWMAKTEVTVAQYRRCVDAGKCSEPDTSRPGYNWNKVGRENHPVNGVTWRQAAAFCKWAGGRLPSESEWEYAARSRGMPWKDSNGGKCEHENTKPVCSDRRDITYQGLCDMGGNVWEWVEDKYQMNYRSAPVNGRAWVTPSGSLRVIRNADPCNPAYDWPVSHRYSAAPSDHRELLGFRCVMDDHVRSK